MPSDGMSNTERLYNELVSKKMAYDIDRFPKRTPKSDTCPYCGSVNLEHHRMPLELDAEIVFCDDCLESWDEF